MLRVDSAGEIHNVGSTDSSELAEPSKARDGGGLRAGRSPKTTPSSSKRCADKNANARRPSHQSILNATDHTTRTEVESLSSSCGSEESGRSHPSAVPKLGDPEDSSTREERSYPQATDSGSSRRAVSFTKIQIREYPIIVGDNPSVLTGTPITIDWEPVEEMTFDFQDYEDTRADTPRSMLELRMPAKHREAILKNQGFSLADRNKGRKMANIVKNQRKRTDEKAGLANVAETMEEWKRATKNATWGRKQKQKERALLNSYTTQDQDS